MIGTLFALTVALTWAQSSEPVQPTRVQASLVVAVSQPDEATRAMVDAAVERGGWFQALTTGAVSLRVPVAQVDGLVEIAGQQGKVIERGIVREDLGQSIADAEGRLDARQEVLERYYAVLNTASSDSIVAVERQIVQAIEQIESLEGRLRVLRDQATFGRVEVSFRFRDRAAPVRDGSSSFAWLNTLNLEDVIDGLQVDRPPWKTRRVSVSAPEGFSAWRRKGRFRAVSPDGVLVRARAARHKPRANLAFWREAVRERMVRAGYAVQAEQDLEVDGVGGALIELAAPLGTEDWSYLVAVFPRGGKVVLFEAAGEVSALDARRDDIMGALNSLSF